MKKNKIPLTIALICILQYANQGISSLPDQCLYYLTRETWHLSAFMLGLIGWVSGFAWYIKIFWGIIADKLKDTKAALLGSFGILLLAYLWVIVYGLNFISLIITGLIINACIAFADTNVDKEMVKAEQELTLKGRLQAIQWSALGIAGLVVALLGAWIAKTFPEPFNYQLGHAIAAIIPIIAVAFLVLRKKKTEYIPSKRIKFKEQLKKLKDKRLLWGLAFIICLQFCPSFGTALMIKLREGMHIDKMFLGYLGALGTVLGVIGYLIYYKFAYKYPLKKLLFFMIIFNAITNLFYLYIPNQWVLILYNVLFGAFGGITFMAFLRFFVSIIPKGGEAFYYALVTSVANFAARAGGAFGGLVYDHYGYTINVLVSTITTLACLWFLPKLQIKEEVC